MNKETEWNKLTKAEKRRDILQRFKYVFKNLNQLVDSKPEYRRNRITWNFGILQMMLNCLWRAELPTLE